MGRRYPDLHEPDRRVVGSDARPGPRCGQGSAASEPVAQGPGRLVGPGEHWTGQPHATDPGQSLHEAVKTVVDEVNEQRQLPTGTSAQRVAAKTAKQQRQSSESRTQLAGHEPERRADADEVAPPRTH